MLEWEEFPEVIVVAAEGAKLAALNSEELKKSLQLASTELGSAMNFSYISSTSQSLAPKFPLTEGKPIGADRGSLLRSSPLPIRSAQLICPSAPLNSSAHPLCAFTRHHSPTGREVRTSAYLRLWPPSRHLRNRNPQQRARRDRGRSSPGDRVAWVTKPRGG